MQCFAQEQAISEERQRTKRIFSDRAKELYKNEIKPQFQQMLDACPVISGQNILSPSVLGSAKNKEGVKSHTDQPFEEPYMILLHLVIRI